ncbi:MAG: peptide ABC transporter substrate-binding protein [Anaerolineales bacterium]
MTMKTFPRFALWTLLALTLLLPACAAAPVATPAPLEAPAPTHSAPVTLTILHPQSPEILNIHLTNNVKDFEPARIVYEPLAVFDKNGVLQPALAKEIPSLENGGLAKDGKSVTWKLREDVLWSDGQPFTAADVAFTFEYIKDPLVKSSSAINYSLVKEVVALDDFTARVTFSEVNPAWYVPFVGTRGVILPSHIFADYKNEHALEAPANQMPVGTGPYMVKAPGIEPQEVLLLGAQIVQTTKLTFVPNPNYREPERIAFDRIIWRGGGTSNEGARLSLQVGEVDVAYDLESVDVDTLSELSKSGQGRLVAAFAPGVERLLLNQTDWQRPSASGEYSSREVPHPLLSDKVVRQAIAYAINRDAIAALYGANGLPAYAILVSPPQYQSPREFYKYDPATANALLDEAKFLDVNGDGVREANGVNIKLTFKSYVGGIAQSAQKLIQKDLRAIGLDVDIKIVDSKNLFAKGAENPESVSRFNADMLMFRTRSSSPDPTAFMAFWTCNAIPQASNNWQGNNNERWCNPEYDALLEQVKTELDEQKRAEIFIQMNDLLVEDAAAIPLVWRASALGVNKTLNGIEPTPWDTVTWNVQNWTFGAP